MTTAGREASPQITIGARAVGAGRPTFIVAEAGVNHNGRLDWALRLVRAARRAGADAVKFQTFDPDRLVRAGSPAHRMLAGLALPRGAFRTIQAAARREGIVFFSTPFDLESLAFLLSLNVPAIKISSGDVTNIPLLGAAAASGKPVILSTGASRLPDVDRAVRILTRARARGVALLHCVSCYPADPFALNLRTIPFFAARYAQCVVGFSDHTRADVVGGIGAPALAVAAGAAIVEKHLTLDRSLPGPDHKTSLDPAGFERMTRQVRDAERILGRFEKTFPEGRGVQKTIRRGVYARRDIAQGERISIKNIDLKRPVSDVPAEAVGLFLGRRARVPIRAGSPLRPSQIR